MKNPLYGYSPIVTRPRFTWPGGAHLAFYLGANIEHYPSERNGRSGRTRVSLGGGRDYCTGDRKSGARLARTRADRDLCHTPPAARTLTDVTLFVSKSVSGPEFLRNVCDQFDQLYADAAHGAGDGARDSSIPTQVSRASTRLHPKSSRRVDHHLRRDCRSLPPTTNHGGITIS